MSERCEICGRPIEGGGKTVVVEGSKLRVCEECAKFGKEVTTPSRERPSGVRRRPGRAPRRGSARPARRGAPSGFDPFKEEWELVPDYPDRVREARERLGMSREDLARELGEKVSVVRRIETGRMEPDLRLARKLERILDVKLLERVEAEDFGGGSSSGGLTLGDVIEVRKG
ncbi:MAG: TIGR00270 family protein [Methanopyri archaeon]|nr:TIGR00270 family protein [Methanopyri archaeon]